MLDTPCAAVFVKLDHRDAMIAEARRCFPNECCGVLVGSLNSNNTLEITRVIPAQNINTSRLEDRYEIDPRTLLQVERELHGNADEFVAGFFHSHPHGPNVPSSIDLEDARGVFEFARRFYVYAIVSPQSESGVRWWNLNSSRDAFDELAVV